VLPDANQLDQVHRAYVEMAIAGRVTEAQRQIFFSVGRELCRTRGAEAVILGGTDLFLAFDGQNSGFAAIDCARIHVEAIFRRSVGTA
jgi:aspartate racemase